MCHTFKHQYNYSQLKSHKIATKLDEETAQNDWLNT